MPHSECCFKRRKSILFNVCLKRVSEGALASLSSWLLALVYQCVNSIAIFRMNFCHHRSRTRDSCDIGSNWIDLGLEEFGDNGRSCLLPQSALNTVGWVRSWVSCYKYGWPNTQLHNTGVLLEIIGSSWRRELVIRHNYSTTPLEPIIWDPCLVSSNIFQIPTLLFQQRRRQVHSSLVSLW